MNKLDFSNVALTDRYYREKFTFDLGNYFKVNGWTKSGRKKSFVPTTDAYISDLYTRGDMCSIDGSPAIYMGCGPWWNTRQNFEFGGMFAYMYIAAKCIHKHCGKEDAFLFCKAFTFPLINDHQAIEDFDVVATLREASLIPYKAEAENYLLMMQHVVPYMKEVTADFIGKLNPAVKEEIDSRLEELCRWVEGTQDEALSYYGLAVRKEYMPEGSPYPAKYYLLNALSWFSQRFNVYSFQDIVRLGNKRAPFAHGDITEFDGPIVPHYKDLDYIKRKDEEWESDSIDDPSAMPTEQEEKEIQLYNILINLLWDDEPYEKEGQTGLKDCWGRVLLPAKYETCDGMHDTSFLTHDNVCVLVKNEGRWALVQRCGEKKMITDYVFDEANLLFQGFYITRIGNRYGLFAPSGRELIPTAMDDIYRPTVCENDIMYKQDGKYGILFDDGTRTKQLLDEVRVNCGYYLSVRIGNDWGYIDQEGNFTRERKEAFVTSNGFDFDSMAEPRHAPGTDIDREGYITLDEMTARMKRKLDRFSVNIDLMGSSLEGTAQIRMGLHKPVLYYEILPDGPTFCVDMLKPYRLKLQDDRYHDMPQSWEGHEKEKKLLKKWLNETNPKTGVRNWAELAYEYCIVPCNADRPLTISYAYRKTLDFKKLIPDGIDDFNFPKIDFQ